MSRTLSRNDVVEILYGATFLGGGGGGSLDFGLKMLDDMEKKLGKPIAMEMVDLDELQADDYAAMVAGLGSPIALLAGNFGPDAVSAFKAYQKALAAEGKQAPYLYSGEMGGFNTFVPMMVAVSAGIKFLDLCGNGRAVPELNTSLNSVRGFPPTPIGLGTIDGNEIIVYPVDDKAGEKIARTLCMAYDMEIGFATWGMNREEMRHNAVPGCVSKAQQIGKALLAAQAQGSDAFAAVAGVTECKRLAKGKIVSKVVEVRDGFDYGHTVIEDQASGATYEVVFQNENLFVLDGEKKCVLTTPDITSMICLSGDKAYCPLTNADTEEGMEVELIISPADEKWWAEDKKAYLCWIDALKSAGYEGPQVRY